ncbi:MAG: hypothetical protein HY927_12750 [Elusimicrobia bacterium]|nr:hypothetical protein [Elusimicrobiota bacterium]
MMIFPAAGLGAPADVASPEQARPERFAWHSLSPKGVCVAVNPGRVDSGRLDLLGKLFAVGESTTLFEATLGTDSFFLGRQSCEAASKVRPGGPAAAGGGAVAAPEPPIEPSPERPRSAPRKRSARETSSAGEDDPPLEAYPTAEYLPGESEGRAKTAGAKKAWVFSAQAGFDEVVDFYVRQLGVDAPDKKDDRRYLAITPTLELRVEKAQDDKVVVSMISRKSIVGIPGLETGGSCVSCSGISQSSSRTGFRGSGAMPATSKIEKQTIQRPTTSKTTSKRKD